MLSTMVHLQVDVAAELRYHNPLVPDATRATFETTPEKIHELTDLYRRFGKQLRVAKSAVLVNEATYDRVRLYEKRVKDLGVRVILFNTLGVACT